MHRMRTRLLALATLSTAISLACGTAPAPAPEALRPPATDAERQAVERARSAAQATGRALKTRLLAALADGPEAAVRVCAQEAPALARSSAPAGTRTGRTSERLRNPANQGPAWATAWLAAQGGRPAAQAEPSSGISQDGRHARFVAPIATEGPCLLCHGEPASIPEGVRGVLRERYPQDHATGYALGDLRGALWGEADVAAP